LRKIVKFIFVYTIYICILPFGLTSLVFYKLFESSMFFDFFAQLFSLVPGFIGPPVRASFYKQTLPKSYMDLFIGFGSFITKIDTMIGKGVFINGHSTVGLADIGDGVVIANFVSILSGGRQHNFSDPAVGILDKAGV